MLQILHPNDGSAESKVAFAHALRLALFFKASLRILHAEPGRLHHESSSLPAVRETLERWELLPAGSPVEAVAELGVQIRKVLLGFREPFEAIAQEAEGTGTDLVVMTTHRKEGAAWLFQGSVAEEVARRWPTLLIPAGIWGFVNSFNGDLRLHRVLVPLDPAEDPELQLAWIIRLLQNWQAEEMGEVRLLQVGDAETEGLVVPGMEFWKWTRKNREGSVVEEILAEATEWKADLVVMSTRGHDSLGDSLWGSRTEQVLHGLHCPLLVVPFTGR